MFSVYMRCKYLNDTPTHSYHLLGSCRAVIFDPNSVQVWGLTGHDDPQLLDLTGYL